MCTTIRRLAMRFRGLLRRRVVEKLDLWLSHARRGVFVASSAFRTAIESGAACRFCTPAWGPAARRGGCAAGRSPSCSCSPEGRGPDHGLEVAANGRGWPWRRGWR